MEGISINIVPLLCLNEDQHNKFNYETNFKNGHSLILDEYKDPKEIKKKSNTYTTLTKFSCFNQNDHKSSNDIKI